ncbi:TetR family transcriptional regulator [Gordonia sp. SID5947]|uniref:TetR/AcrR family transcriptional regulator n=1 Tax=Gordonia sp. SID5947 TaxID=2690315 RepID=UPI00136EEED3|nr:TetR/AcrR family transcriptional regulator [Gordonia sp. SID5947]MYR08476.1 TetR family transcriptional regulator [Gordonia sp. SID5947]
MSDTRATADWLAPERAELAAQRILDIAEQMFIEKGVSMVTMRDIASAAGCSRATLYRYYPGKSEVLAAYVDRAATELGAAIAAAVRHEPDAGARLVAAVTTAVDGVRSNPALSAWFVSDAAARSANLALLSPAIEEIAVEFLGDIAPDVDPTQRRDRARWVVRVILSLLTSPGETAADERVMLERFVVPVVTTAGARVPRG